MRSDYDEQILKQSEEQMQLTIARLEAENRALIDENSALRSENRALHAEIQYLREKCNELERTMEDRIAAAVAQAVYSFTGEKHTGFAVFLPPCFVVVTLRSWATRRFLRLAWRQKSSQSRCAFRP